MAELVQTQQRGHIFEIVLSRPEKRNAMNWQLMTELDAAIMQADRSSGLRAIIVRGEGSGFSAGIDVTTFVGAGEHFGENWRQNLFPLTAAYQGVLNRLERSPVPSIALLHGYCLGLGFELALACDFRIAAVGTRIASPEVRLGIIPDVGGTTRLTRLVGPGRSKEYIMTGKSFDLADAERWGVVNYVVPENDLMSKGDALVSELVQAAPLAVSYAKRVIDGLSDVERGLQLEGWAQNMLIQTEDFEIGAQAALTKQTPEWKGK
ncbi:MAG: enoyl-CoA hydratase/isomerase family protein [Anaerolineae bacterium]